MNGEAIYTGPKPAKKPGDRVLGATIRSARRALNITQESLADRIGATKAAVSQWESGANYIRDDNRRALAAVLNISLDVMFGVGDETLNLTLAERLLIEQLRQLPPETQKAIMLIVSSTRLS